MENTNNTPWIDLTNPKIRWIGKGEDLVADVFFLNGSYYKAIRKDTEEEFWEIRPLVEYLAEKDLVTRDRVYPVVHDKYSFVSMSETCRWVDGTNCCTACLKEAALKWVAINKFLLEVVPGRPYGLCDGHSGNFVLSNNSRPLWCDMGSITHRQSSMDFGLSQFARYYVYPLLLLSSAKSSASIRERMVTSQPEGIGWQEAHDAMASQFDIEFLQSPGGFEKRACVLDKLQALIEPVSFESLESFWTGYRGDNALQSAWTGHLLATHPDTRFRTVANIVRSLNVGTFIDIGANDGLFSLICCRLGMSGIAADIEDAALNRLYEFIKNCPGIRLNVLYAAFGKLERKAELVLALALTHHLALSQNMSFDQIAEIIANSCTRFAITEFMPDGLGGTSDIAGPYPNPLPEWYTLDRFLTALHNKFRYVEVIDYDRPVKPSRRTLILCGSPKG